MKRRMEEEEEEIEIIESDQEDQDEILLVNSQQELLMDNNDHSSFSLEEEGNDVNSNEKDNNFYNENDNQKEKNEMDYFEREWNGKNRVQLSVGSFIMQLEKEGNEEIFISIFGMIDNQFNSLSRFSCGKGIQLESIHPCLEDSFHLKLPWLLMKSKSNNEWEYHLSFIDVQSLIYDTLLSQCLNQSYLEIVCSFKLPQIENNSFSFQEVQMIDGPNILFCNSIVNQIAVVSWVDSESFDWKEEERANRNNDNIEFKPFLGIYFVQMPSSFLRVIYGGNGIFNNFQRDDTTLLFLTRKEGGNQDNIHSRAQCSSIGLLSNVEMQKHINKRTFLQENNGTYYLPFDKKEKSESILDTIDFSFFQSICVDYCAENKLDKNTIFVASQSKRLHKMQFEVEFIQFSYVPSKMQTINWGGDRKSLLIEDQTGNHHLLDFRTLQQKKRMETRRKDSDWRILQRRAIYLYYSLKSIKLE
eukprot:TRINITY_DN5525_c0_g1_i1.p1 TRINITY_DN5525_c0_g1~~TRINITY_DN5525_c0_g1_i1.p1  ORF type:complete len:472 (-),score=136.46 TRINITY_DN5525_c0_g1_i1:1264-2679(-)